MKNQSPPTVLRIFSLFLYQTAALFNAQKICPIWRASDKKSRKIYLLPQFWEFSHYSFTKQQFSSMRKKFSLFGEPRTWPIQSHEKSISSHSFENFLTIPLPNSISLQCAKNSAYLQSLRHLIWILAKKWFRLGHNCDLINLDMT